MIQQLESNLVNQINYIIFSVFQCTNRLASCFTDLPVRVQGGFHIIATELLNLILNFRRILSTQRRQIGRITLGTSTLLSSNNLTLQGKTYFTAANRHAGGAAEANRADMAKTARQMVDLTANMSRTKGRRLTGAIKFSTAYRVREIWLMEKTQLEKTVECEKSKRSD